jgi:SAM-dependent methyltransferase
MQGPKEVKKRYPLTKYYNWLIFSIVNPELRSMLQKYAHGRLVDIGCGEKPYKEMAAEYVDEHVGVDHAQTLHDKTQIDLIGSAYSVPVGDETYDSLLCTYVLEHLEEPGTAIAEAYRILKKGGIGIYTVPFFWHLHEAPRDFFRFSKYGLQYLFEKNGFETVELKALSGFFVTFGQETAYFLNGFRGANRFSPLYWLLPPIVILVQAVAFVLGKIEKSEDFTAEYIIVVKKK